MRLLVKKFNALRKKLCEKNFVREKFNFNSILTKRPVFDKKVVKTVFDNSISCLTPDQPHRTQNALFKFLMRMIKICIFYT